MLESDDGALEGPCAVESDASRLADQTCTTRAEARAVDRYSINGIPIDPLSRDAAATTALTPTGRQTAPRKARRLTQTILWTQLTIGLIVTSVMA